MPPSGRTPLPSSPGRAATSSKQVIVAIVLVAICPLASHCMHANVRQYLNSPCPNTFQYKLDQNGYLYAIIQTFPPNQNFLQLNVELSVGNHVGNYNGNIELAYPKNQILQDIFNRRPIHYKVFFPTWNRIPPQVTKIQMNGNVLCTGPKIAADGIVTVLTTINLQHKLRVNSNPLNTQESEDTNPRDEIPTLPPNYNINFKPQPVGNPDGTPVPTPATASPVTQSPKPILNPDLDWRETPGKQNFAAICGRSASTNSLVVNGFNVPRGAFPWIVAMFWVKNTGLEYRCGGTLVSRTHAITAAHCVIGPRRNLLPEELIIVLGKLNIKKWTLGDGEKMVEPSKIHIHPDYTALSSDADIAIIVLSQEMEFTRFISPICLWDGDNDLEHVTGMKGTVVGWGRDENGRIMTDEPKQTALPIVSQEQCLRSPEAGPSFQVITSERTFCAGFKNGSGPCNGDSGSGFILKRNDRWYLRGVVSMSISDTEKRTCDLRHYVVFTDTSKFLDWINNYVQ